MSLSPPPAGTAMSVRIGWIITGIVALFLWMDAAMKLLRLDVVIDTMAQLGWPASSVVPLGTILLVVSCLYVIPRTSLLGAILLTGYLGGAIATHLRIDSPLLTHTFFGVYVGGLTWLGLFLRSSDFRRALGFDRQGQP